MKLVFKNATHLLFEAQTTQLALKAVGLFAWFRLRRLQRLIKMLELAQQRDAAVELSEQDYKTIFIEGKGK